MSQVPVYGGKSDDEMLELVKQDLRLSIRYLGQMNSLFYYDTKRILELCVQKDAEFKRAEIKYEEYMFWLRNLVRISFAQMEGVAYLMRQVVIWACERSDLSLTEGEVAKLAEEEIVDNEGEKTRKRRFNSFRDNIELAFKYFPQVFGASFRLNKGGAGWASFLNAIQTRNAVTHPKKPSEFMLSGTAVKEVRDTVIWFSEMMSGLLTACEAAAKKTA
jgi:hypothetical protein